MNNFARFKKIEKMWFALFVISGCFLFLNEMAFAECSETFSWRPNNESNIVAYKIYYGKTNNGPYPNAVNVSTESIVEDRVQGIVTGLTCGEKYYFVCVAVNEANIESPYSTQLALTVGVGSELPGSPGNVEIME